MLEAGRVITIGDVCAVLESAGLSIRRGNVVLLYTGWSKLWKRRDLRYCESEPGPGRETATRLADNQIIALGTDTIAVDIDPPEDAAYPRVVHQIILVDRSIHLIENLYLNELVRERFYEFLFVLATPKLNGGTAFPVDRWRLFDSEVLARSGRGGLAQLLDPITHSFARLRSPRSFFLTSLSMKVIG